MNERVLWHAGRIVDEVGDPRRSRRMVRAQWAGASNPEEARDYLQNRLTTLFRVMFASFAALVAFVEIEYAVSGEGHIWISAISGIGIVAMAVLWRAILVRRRQTIEQLHVIDIVYLVGTNAVLATQAAITPESQPATYTVLIYACLSVLTRALIVPSTGRRTAVVTAIAFVPIVAAAVVVAYGYRLGLSSMHQQIPDLPFVLQCIQVATIAVLLSTAGSHIIYGLREQVSVVQRLGQYTLERKIGEGGMGTVYLGRHLMLRRDTAVKRLRPDKIHPDNLARFEREVQILSQLAHPNTVAVYDYGPSPDGEFYYYAMEYLGGGVTLETLVREHGAQPIDRVVAILVQACGALHEAHERGIVHRDIKPANIMLCERGGLPDFVKVLDFGLANEITADSGASTQVILGTPDYLAPEAVTDPSAVGPATDLYALGAVGYFLASGRRVFEGKTTLDALMLHATETPRAVDGVPPELAAAIARCLAKRPSDRFASAAELAAALRAVPRANDWSAASARAWWDARREREPSTAPAAESEAMTIDLVARELA